MALGEVQTEVERKDERLEEQRVDGYVMGKPYVK